MSSDLKLFVIQVDDEYSRDNFQQIERHAREQSLLRGRFKFFEITFAKAVTNFKFPHKLGFAPKDVIQTSLMGAGVLTWNYARFDATNLDITTSAACVARAFIGCYEEGV